MPGTQLTLKSLQLQDIQATLRLLPLRGHPHHNLLIHMEIVEMVIQVTNKVPLKVQRNLTLKHQLLSLCQVMGQRIQYNLWELRERFQSVWNFYS